jgi:hypothetical protein
MSAMLVQGQHDAYRRPNPANTMQPALRSCPRSVMETSMYPRARLDALSDAIFGVAMNAPGARPAASRRVPSRQRPGVAGGVLPPGAQVRSLCAELPRAEAVMEVGSASAQQRGILRGRLFQTVAVLSPARTPGQSLRMDSGFASRRTSAGRNDGVGPAYVGVIGIRSDFPWLTTGVHQPWQCAGHGIFVEPPRNPVDCRRKMVHTAPDRACLREIARCE